MTMAEWSFKSDFIDVVAHFYHVTRGRRHSDVAKTILLCTSRDPPNWTQALIEGQKAKDSGIRIGIMTRGDEAVNEENFRKLASSRMVWFEEENDHFKAANELVGTGSLCPVPKRSTEVSII